MTIPYSTDTDGGGGGTTIINNVDLINENPVIIGTENPSAQTGTDCIAIGKTSGTRQIGSDNIAIGESSGAFQIAECIAIGKNSGNLQSSNSIAIGSNSAGASNNQWERTIAIGTNAQQNFKNVGLEIGNEDAIAIGSTAGTQQCKRSIAIGKDSGANQDLDCIAIGKNSGADMRDNTICIGNDAGGSGSTSNEDSISIGTSANSTANSGTNSIAIGKNARSSTNNSIVLNATGNILTSTNQDSTYVAPVRGNTTVKPALLYDTTDKELLTQTSLTVNSSNDEVACTAELKSQRLIFNNNIAIGPNSGVNNQSSDNIAIGENALTNGVVGETGVIAIGTESANANANRDAICIGTGSCRFGAGSNSVSIGPSSNTFGGGFNSVALGTLATTPNLNSMVLNATGNFLSSANDNATYIAPLRANPATHQALLYDTTSKELLTQSVLTVDSVNDTVSVNGELSSDRYLMNGATNTIKIGADAGLNNTAGIDSIYIGRDSGKLCTASSTIAIGLESAFDLTGPHAICIGERSGYYRAGPNSILIGRYAGEYSGGVGVVGETDTICIGGEAGRLGSGTQAICIGSSAGKENSSDRHVSIGFNANVGTTNGAGLASIAVGAFSESPNDNSIVLNASNSTLTTNASGFFVNPIRNVGSNQFLCYNSTSSEITTGDLQKVSPIEIGTNPDSTTSGEIKIGEGAGGASQGVLSVAVGYSAGVNQGIGSVAIGNSAGLGQGEGSVCIGNLAGGTTAGNNCVLLGKGANAPNNNTIVLYGRGSTFTAPRGFACFIDPVRTLDNTMTTGRKVIYNTSDKELLSVVDGVIYGNLASGAKNSTTSAIVGISQVFNSNTSLYTLASNQITVATAGHYEVSFAGLFSAVGTRAMIKYIVSINGTEIGHSEAIAYIRNISTGANKGSLYGHCLIELTTANSTIEFKYQRLDTGASSLDADTTRYSIKKLD